MDAGLEFAALAEEFCRWCENGETLPTQELAEQTSRYLARLQAAVLLLHPEPEYAELPLLSPQVRRKVELKFADFSGMYYRECWDPDPQSDEEPSLAEVAEDVLDVYDDLRAGVCMQQAGQTAQALWHWWFCHRVHWGRHAVGGLLALQCLWISRQH